MSAADHPRLVSLYRYPVKGLSPEALDACTLTPGETIPFDRAFAIENGPGRFDEAAPRHLPKIAFLMLMRDERLATLRTHFDAQTGALVVLRDGRQVARGVLSTRIGRQMIEQFFAAYMQTALRGAPRIVQAAGHSFSDVAAKCVHIVNLATVREVERAGGRPVDPLRFRANLYIDGVAPWAEFGWLGRSIRIGATELAVFKRTVRCDATNVDPATGARDMAIPAVLERSWGHSDLGIYAHVAAGGTIRPGDAIDLG